MVGRVAGMEKLAPPADKGPDPLPTLQLPLHTHQLGPLHTHPPGSRTCT